MTERAHLPRISIAMVFLAIVPWTIVLAAVLRVECIPDTPVSEVGDFQEMQSLTRSLDDYAAKFGEYPPDFTSGNPRQEINEHLRYIFPYRDAQLDIPAFVDDLGPDNALAFWLQGLYVNNPRFPLTGKVSRSQRPITDEEIMAEIEGDDFIALLKSQGIVWEKGLGDTPAVMELLSSYRNLQKQQQKLSRMKKGSWHILMAML